MSGEEDKSKKVIETLVSFIKTELNKGTSKEQIINHLVNNVGLPKDTITTLVNNVNIEGEKSSSGISNIVISLISIVIVYLGLNGLLWLGQELYHKNDVKECEQLERKISQLKQETSTLEKALQMREKKHKEILALQKELQNGVKTNYARYSSLIDSYNNETPEYTKQLDTYNAMINQHNEIVNKYNSLAKSAYSRWWLIPIPMPGSHHPQIH